MSTAEELKKLIESQVKLAIKTEKLNAALAKLRIISKSDVDRLDQLMTEKPVAVKVRGKIWECFRPQTPTDRQVEGRVAVRELAVL